VTASNGHSVSVAAVITDDAGRVLVVQRHDNGKWEIPGGILELHESIHDGVRREVEEETGMLIEPERLTDIYKNLRLGVVALVFRARIVSGQPGPTEESQRVDWVDPRRRIRPDGRDLCGTRHRRSRRGTAGDPGARRRSRTCRAERDAIVGSVAPRLNPPVSV
jgi:8-oxo-dGTP pyrophosphatase MutT (NUDIX family)